MTTQAPKEALGQSEAFLSFMEALSRAAKVERSVLILGERGTGKELAAARLHFLSPRWQEPLVTLNCAALAPGVMESELFGHEAGAFTGASGRRAGRFEVADGGTLFLDEIANTPLTVQEKILRAVEYGSFERVGGSKSVNVDVRMLGATNRNLKAMAEAGAFHPDLLDRLSFEVLVLPPLRERGNDIMLLANHFASRMALDLGRMDTPGFSPSARDSLMAHSWPGNVRELKNVVERAVYKSLNPFIDEISFDPFAGLELGGGPLSRPQEPSREKKTTRPHPAGGFPGRGHGVRGRTVAAGADPMPPQPEAGRGTAGPHLSPAKGAFTQAWRPGQAIGGRRARRAIARLTARPHFFTGVSLLRNIFGWVRFFRFSLGSLAGSMLITLTFQVSRVLPTMDSSWARDFR